MRQNYCEWFNHLQGIRLEHDDPNREAEVEREPNENGKPPALASIGQRRTDGPILTTGIVWAVSRGKPMACHRTQASIFQNGVPSESRAAAATNVTPKRRTPGTTTHRPSATSMQASRI